MTEPTVKKPSKKTFHFPKGAVEAPEAAAEVAVPATTVASKKRSTTPKKASKKQPAGKVKATPVDAALVEAAPVDATPAKTAVEAKAKRVKKEKVVRDSFTMPKSDYDKIAALKQKCLAEGMSVKKSEILRAGLLLLESAAPKRLLAAVSSVEQVKTGRPAKT
ncbi:hypothetical protein [Paraburkholderia sp. SIMBA_030]|uniref:hypothetical protein n=1 Tax=Paraburkholderia sp. SIMBA_030 TaxID=3085773 RepID=UPI00397BC82F